MNAIRPEHILYPAGHHAVGKTELSDYLVEGYGFQVIETGKMVRGLYASRDEAFTNHSLGEFIKAIEQIEPGYFDKKLAKRIEGLDDQYGRIIVNGMRSITNIERTKEVYPNTLHSIIWIDAQFDALYERYKLREDNDLTTNQFNDLLRFDMELGLALIQERADFLIQNDSSLEALRERADIILQRNLGIQAVTSAYGPTQQ